MWIKLSRQVLPQQGGGCDYGTPRDVMMHKGGVVVFKTRGHTGWSAVGQTSYYKPQWVVITADSYSSRKNLNDGYSGDEGRMTDAIWEKSRPIVAKEMGLSLDDMPAKPPRGGTLVWCDTEEQANKLRRTDEETKAKDAADHVPTKPMAPDPTPIPPGEILNAIRLLIDSTADMNRTALEDAVRILDHRCKDPNVAAPMGVVFRAMQGERAHKVLTALLEHLEGKLSSRQAALRMVY